MGGILGGGSAPAPTPAPPPAAPVEEATFKPGGEDDGGRADLKKKAMGKKRLQIPLTGGAAAKPAVQSGK
jgi:hypothetical protein